MAKNCCMECKYFNHKDNNSFGTCTMYNHYKHLYEECEYFCEKSESSETSCDQNKIKELEERVSKLEQLLVRLI